MFCTSGQFVFFFFTDIVCVQSLCLPSDKALLHSALKSPGGFFEL